MKRRQFIQTATSVIPIALLKDSLSMNPFSTTNKETQEAHYFPDLLLKDFVFSKKGSWLIFSLNQIDGKERLVLKTLRGAAISHKYMKGWACDFFILRLFDHKEEVDYSVQRLPWQLNLNSSKGNATIAFLDEETIHFNAENLKFALVPMQDFGWQFKVSENEFLALASAAKFVQHFRSNISTKINLIFKSQDKNSDYIEVSSSTENTTFCLRISQTETIWKESLPSIHQCIETEKADIEAWMKKMPTVPEELFKAAQTAWYLLHYFQVSPAGQLKRQALLSSKNSWLTKIWTWDNCFHALALALADLKLGWEQIFLCYDYQTESGALPDSLNDLGGEFGYMKPPIYGWTIMQLIQMGGINNSLNYIRMVYEPLKKQTEYWFNYRDRNGNGLCEYLHGNDSGWDNCTLFDEGVPVEGADLAAYLITQMDSLSYIAGILKKDDEAKRWKERADNQYQILIEKCWKGDRFYSCNSLTGKEAENGSLMNYLPVVLGKRLPEDIRKKMIANLQTGKGFLTEFGLASESILSKKHKYDGYWRGPIWGPPNYQIFYGLKDMGETTIAMEIAKRFCKMCNQFPVFNENYDPASGKGLQAPGVTWTAAVFILLSHELSKKQK